MSEKIQKLKNIKTTLSGIVDHLELAIDLFIKENNVCHDIDFLKDISDSLEDAGSDIAMVQDNAYEMQSNSEDVVSRADDAEATILSLKEKILTKISESQKLKDNDENNKKE